MAAATYRKKPVEIQAWQWDGTPSGATPIIDWLLSNDCTATWTEAHEAGTVETAETPGFGNYPAEPDCIRIDTLEGTMRATVGDWVIQGVKGEFYPCKPDIFTATYEAVE